MSAQIAGAREQRLARLLARGLARRFARRFVTWWMSFLNFQIEHHLFPSMPQFRHPLISPRVKLLFEKHGLPYDNRPYTQALWDTFANLHAVGKNAGLSKAQ